MPRITRRRCLVLFALAYVSSACLFSGQRASRVSGGSPQQKTEPAKLTKLYFGVSACSDAGCHNQRDEKGLFVCRYDEVKTWTERDKHKIAYKVLSEPRAQNIARLMGIKDAAKEPSCINCHGVHVENDKLRDASFKIEDGVSCVACHGPYEEWATFHSAPLRRAKWRALSREDKERHYGMRDLWDPAKRAALCASCHVGSIEEKKVVTHEMYAAGHPPLPGLEVAFFSQEMPRHWNYLVEKKPEIQKLFAFDPAKNNLERTELVLLAGLVSFRETMNLIAGQAGPKDAPWPELAHFDCYACHHDLKSKSWRQQRGYAGKPGRPSMRAWPLALVDLSMAHFADKKAQAEFRAAFKKLTDAYDNQPFGEPTQVAAAARGLASWADQAIVEVRGKRIDKLAVRSLILALGDISKNKILDYDSARQMAWAFTVMLQEYDPAMAKDARIQEGLATLEKTIKLKLPQGQEAIEGHLKDSLLHINNYDPTTFGPAMQGLVTRFNELAK